MLVILEPGQGQTDIVLWLPASQASLVEFWAQERLSQVYSAYGMTFKPVLWPPNTYVQSFKHKFAHAYMRNAYAYTHIHTYTFKLINNWEQRERVMWQIINIKVIIPFMWNWVCYNALFLLTQNRAFCYDKTT